MPLPVLLVPILQKQMSDICQIFFNSPLCLFLQIICVNCFCFHLFKQKWDRWVPDLDFLLINTYSQTLPPDILLKYLNTSDSIYPFGFTLLTSVFVCVHTVYLSVVIYFIIYLYVHSLHFFSI